MYHSTWSPLILCVYIYVGGIYTYVHSCVYMCVGGLCWVFFFLSLHFIFARQGLSLNLQLPVQARLPGSPHLCVPSAGWCHVYCHAWLLCGCSGSKLFMFPQWHCTHQAVSPALPTYSFTVLMPFPSLLNSSMFGTVWLTVVWNSPHALPVALSAPCCIVTFVFIDVIFPIRLFSTTPRPSW